MDKILFFIWAPGVTSRIAIPTLAQGSTVSHLKVLTNFEWYMQYKYGQMKPPFGLFMK